MSPATVLRHAAPDTDGGGSRLRAVLVAVEMMLSVMLLVGASLLVRSLIELQRADLGFDPERLIAVNTSLPDARYSTAAGRIAFRDQLLERVRALPGVKGATVAMGVPPRYGVSGVPSLELSSASAAVPTAGVLAFNEVRSDFFSVLGIRMIAGRPFTDAEARSESGVVILGEGLARRLSSDGDVRKLVGEQVRTDPKAPWRTVVGVSADVAAMGITGVARHSQMYSPFGEGPRRGGADALPELGLLIVRGSVDPAALSTLVRDAVRQIDPALGPPDIDAVDSYFDASLAAPRFNTVLLSIFAALALILAMVGLFGVLSYAVARRTREIGIRVALGALPGDVRSLVIRQGMRPVLAGLAAGVLGALLIARVLGSILYGVTAHDPTAFLVAASIISLTALLACFLPARRATQVDPVNALTSE
jgi:putative ABC transport system permease protein